MAKKYLSNFEMLQSYSVIFENFKKNEDLAKELAEYGYGIEKMSNGKALLDKANELYSINIQKKQEETTSSVNYQKIYTEVTQMYSSHRKRAKIIFKNDEKRNSAASQQCLVSCLPSDSKKSRHVALPPGPRCAVISLPNDHRMPTSAPRFQSFRQRFPPFRASHRRHR